MDSLTQHPQTAQAHRAPPPAAGRRSPTPDEYEARMALEAKAGSHEAFDWLYRRYHNPIYQYVYRMVGDRATAEDLTADAFLKVWLKLPETRDDDFKFGAWCYRVAQNVCLDRLRHNRLVKWQPWEAFVSVFHVSQVAKDSPERDALDAETRRDVREVLDALGRQKPQPHSTHAPGPLYRAALVLQVHHDLSYDEIAAALGITRAAVKSTLYRARLAFKALWEARHGAAPEAAP
jgi:RNA polymerase sigma-70 factor (ECF subfamily)